ncbi:amino acid ABC transporter permease [Lysinibacter cavernae]|uniref:Polar amino acid transport system permease protein n=1 Tax=Lysinibacter cavernae TaxID=1640652 RepID=A0A7X5TTB4_9MICO|nr:amino acid ABC transporter permease [Lysinibacter cavernae]NIH54456.1 polar amino acid transport system permease protein [Lysinibacter cavernae]
MTVHTQNPEVAAATQRGEPPQHYDLRKPKHPGRWIAAIIIIAILGAIIWAFAVGQINWKSVGQYFGTKQIFQGFLQTIWLAVLSMVVGIVLGGILAVMRLSKNPVASTVSWLYVWAFRGTPVFVQLLIWFNIALVFPTIGFPGGVEYKTIEVVTPLVAAVLGLGLNEAAYLAEIFRGGLLSVEKGQKEAATALGIPSRVSLMRVIVPQAMPSILPPVGNEAITLLKTTSLAAVIAFPELLSRAQQIYFVNGQVMELLFVAAIWYLIATSVLSVFQYYLERHFSRGKDWQTGIGDRMIGDLIRLVKGGRTNANS